MTVRTRPLIRRWRQLRTQGPAESAQALVLEAIARIEHTDPAERLRRLLPSIEKWVGGPYRARAHAVLCLGRGQGDKITIV